MGLTTWAWAGLLFLSVLLTFVTRWMVSRLGRAGLRADLSFWSIAADLGWICLLVGGGVLALRYAERSSLVGLVYLGSGFAAFGLSFVRALLLRRSRQARHCRAAPARETLLREVVHHLNYLLAATDAYLAVSLLIQQRVRLLLLVPLWVGALLPDLDTVSSPAGRVLPFLSRWLEKRLGHSQQWHSLSGWALVSFLASPLILVTNVQVWYLLSLGFLSHLVVDMLRSEGVLFLWPLRRVRYNILGGPVQFPGSPAERRLALALGLVTALLLLAVDVGPSPAPEVAAPTLQQSLDRYRGFQGRYLAMADVEGIWQATGRRVSYRFEILNAVGESFVMLDRYSGRVFTAGHGATDHLYLRRLTVVQGAMAHVKPVEVHLETQRLQDALPVVYEMQREAGLQHIFVSGVVMLPLDQEKPGQAPFEVDLAQTRLQKIQAHEPGRYSFHYLTAADLVALAHVWVEAADLVIVATSVSPATGPTATALPQPSAMPNAVSQRSLEVGILSSGCSISAPDRQYPAEEAAP